MLYRATLYADITGMFFKTSEFLGWDTLLKHLFNGLTKELFREELLIKKYY